MSTHYPWLVAVAMFIAGCANGPTAAPTEQFATWVVYKRGDSGERVECQGFGVAELCGVTLGPLPTYSDCSDEQFLCLFDSASVFAIPRANLSLGQKFTVFGADLVVDQCFGGEDSCEVALISSKCLDLRTCGCWSGTEGTHHFYFVKDVGVTVFYSLREKGAGEGGEDAKALRNAIPLGSYYLVAERGFLVMPMALPRAAPRASCRN